VFLLPLPWRRHYHDAEVIPLGNEVREKRKMKKKEFTVIIEQDEEGYFVAEVPELAGCHTQARSLGTLMKRVKEAISLCRVSHPEEAGILDNP
jgi:Uncharacterized conserved protein